MCLSVTLSAGVLLFQRISENTGFYKKTFRSVVPEAIIPFNCSERFLINNGLEEVAIEGNYSLGNN